MLLTLDIGNTEITVGLYRGDELVSHWRLTTNPGTHARRVERRAGVVPDRSAATRRARCGRHAWPRWRPPVTRSVADGVESATGCTGASRSSARTPLPLTLDVDEPLAVGADRIVNILAAVEPLSRRTRSWSTSAPRPPSTASPPTDGSSAASIMPGLRTSADQLIRTRRQAHRHRAHAAGARHRAHDGGAHPGRRALRCGGRGGRDGAPDARGMARGTASPHVVATGGLVASWSRRSRRASSEVAIRDLTLHGLRLAARPSRALTW